MECEVARVDATETPADQANLAAGSCVNRGQALAQRGAHLQEAAKVPAHLPGMGVVSEFRQIAAQRRHREVARQKARQRQHRVTVASRRPHQERRHHQAGVEFEDAPHLRQKQTEARRAKRAAPTLIASVRRRRHFLSDERVPPRPVIAANMSLKRSANFGSNDSQLCISASGDTFWMLSIIWFWSFSITAVCIGCTSGSPKNCRASSGVQSISTLTFMGTPWLPQIPPAVSSRPRPGRKPSEGAKAKCGQPNRSTAYGLGSVNGVAPVIISASNRPVTGPRVNP